ncbi:hypothetical protein NE237_021061 [Protea cynaroides]|uniref:Uncharacterized protein n=1 Tax=Protea cynaroides TaxID=273540 RepID=A0A9Q0H9M6_9MAGN|nr:hypothetical protein NE237_021061 [Protea cynaroides]
MRKIGDEVNRPNAVTSPDDGVSRKEGSLEASTMMFGALDELFGMCPMLNYRASGGLVTHYRWNSVMEGSTEGVLLLAWPLQADQFVNERLLVEYLATVFLDELQSILCTKELTLPRLFIGGVDEIRQQHETGELKDVREDFLTEPDVGHVVSFNDFINLGASDSIKGKGNDALGRNLGQAAGGLKTAIDSREDQNSE